MPGAKIPKELFHNIEGYFQDVQIPEVKIADQLRSAVYRNNGLECYEHQGVQIPGQTMVFDKKPIGIKPSLSNGELRASHSSKCKPAKGPSVTNDEKGSNDAPDITKDRLFILEYFRRNNAHYVMSFVSNTEDFILGCESGIPAKYSTMNVNSALFKKLSEFDGVSFSDSTMGVALSHIGARMQRQWERILTYRAFLIHGRSINGSKAACIIEPTKDTVVAYLHKICSDQCVPAFDGYMVRCRGRKLFMKGFEDGELTQMVTSAIPDISVEESLSPSGKYICLMVK